MARAHTHRIPGQVIQSNNKSGVSGVYRTTGPRGYPCWVAYYNRDARGRRVHRQKRFYFGRERTEDEAMAAAKAFRLAFNRAIASGELRNFFDTKR